MSRQAREPGRLADREHLRVGAGIGARLFLVVRLDDDVARHEDATDRHVAGGFGRRGEIDRSGHARDVVVHIACRSETAECYPGGPELVRPDGFEPPISAFGGLRVIQLRYGRVGVEGFAGSRRQSATVRKALFNGLFCTFVWQ